MATAKKPEVRLRHILEQIDGLSASIKNIDFKIAEGNFLYERAVERAIQIISEAARELPPDLRDRYRDAHWRPIIGIGNLLQHEYYRIKSRDMWEIATVHLPALRPTVELMLADLDRKTPTQTLSLAALSILDAGPIGQVEAAAAAGWESVGLRLNPLLTTDTRVVGDPAKEIALARAMRDTNMRLLEIGVFPITPNIDVPALEPVLAFAATFSARYVVCPVEDSDKRRRLDAYGRLAELCARYSLDALVEFNPYSACPNLAEAHDIVAAAARANAGFVIDALHLSRSGGDPADLASVDPALLKLVHLCDAPAFTPGARSTEELRKESRTARLLPGEGALPLRRLLAALPRDCAISVEAPSARLAGLSATDRARETLRVTQAFLSDR